MEIKHAPFFKTILSVVFLSVTVFGFSQSEVIPLWPDKIPNFRETNEKETQSKGDIFWIYKVQKPSLEIYLPTKSTATGKAVVICPGGSYSGLAYDWEGSDIAKWFNAKGIAAFILKYRMPQSKSVIVSHEAPLQDAQRAIRLVRKNAEQWNVNKNQIGIMGFSAGGHLAATLSTRYDHQTFDPIDHIDTQNARPDFAILLYPIISMKSEITHQSSKDNLLGQNPTKTLIDFYSNEHHVNNNTPSTLLIHSSDDYEVPVSNSLLFYKALQKEGVSSEMHLYPYGGHGFSLAIGKGYLQSWTDRMEDWLNNL